MVSFVILIIILAYASIEDIRTMEVPLWCWTIPIFSKLLETLSVQILDPEVVEMAIDDPWWSEIELYLSTTLFLSFFLAVGVFLLFLLLAHFSDFGGADVLLITSIVFTMGIIGIYSVIISFIFALPFTIYMKIRKREKPYPFVPFLFFGTLLTCLKIFGV